MCPARARGLCVCVCSSGIERLALVLGADIASTFEDPSATKLGSCKLIEEIMIGEDKLLHFSGVELGEVRALHKYSPLVLPCIPTHHTARCLLDALGDRQSSFPKRQCEAANPQCMFVFVRALFSFACRSLNAIPGMHNCAPWCELAPFGRGRTVSSRCSLCSVAGMTRRDTLSLDIIMHRVVIRNEPKCSMKRERERERAVF